MVTAPAQAPAAARNKLTIWRRLSQMVFVMIIGQWSFYGIFRCPFLVPYISCQNCPVITCHGAIFSMFWGFWLLLPATVLLFGRAFCGWACPGGLVTQLFGLLSNYRTTAKSLWEKIAPYGKYLAIGVCLYLYFVMDQPRTNIPIRAGEFFPAVGLTFEHADLSWIVRTAFALSFLVLGMVLTNAWCRYACPTGGLLEIFKPLSLFKVYKTRRCNLCGQCREVCYMETLPAETNCTNCGDCLSSCPRDAIKLGRRKKLS